jgi:hypothetical protein
LISNASYLCLSVARQWAGCWILGAHGNVAAMNDTPSDAIEVRGLPRLRLFAREILLASAITLAAVVFFFASDGEPEHQAIAAGTPAGVVTPVSQQ